MQLSDEYVAGGEFGDDDLWTWGDGWVWADDGNQPIGGIPERAVFVGDGSGTEYALKQKIVDDINVPGDVFRLEFDMTPMQGWSEGTTIRGRLGGTVFTVLPGHNVRYVRTIAEGDAWVEFLAAATQDPSEQLAIDNVSAKKVLSRATGNNNELSEVWGW
jgi:hypothetical protein